MKVDTLAAIYAAISPYAYVGNNPIIFIDPDGQDIILSYGSCQDLDSYVDMVNENLGGQL